MGAGDAREERTNGRDGNRHAGNGERVARPARQYSYQYPHHEAVLWVSRAATGYPKTVELSKIFGICNKQMRR